MCARGAVSVAVLLLASAACAATFTVSTEADTRDGVCDAHCSVREAIDAANAAPGADTVVVPAGVYALSRAGVSEDDNAAGDLDVTDDLTLSGAGARQTVLDGNRLDRVINVINAALELADVTLRRGAVTTPAGAGAGLAVLGGAATLRRVSVTDNDTNGWGGGLYAGASHLTVIDSTLAGNHAGRGGGLYYQGFTRQLEVHDSTVSGNVAQVAGGIFVDLECGFITPCLIAGSTIADNQGLAGAGGLQTIAPLGSLRVTSSLFAGNAGGSCASGSAVSLGYNLDDDGACPWSATGDHSGVPAGLLPLRANGGSTDTHALAIGSPALDGGDPAGCDAADQRGQPRSGTCDIGAFEASPGACGDGIAHLGEACDDGNAVEDDCCSATCTVAADGAACAADADLCTVDACNASAARCEHASAPAPSCRTATRSFLTLRTGDGLQWKWLRGAATAASDFGDPSSTTRHAVCVYGPDATAVLARIDVGPDATRWRASSGGFRYRDSAAGRKLLLRGGATGRARLQVRAADTPLPPLPLAAGAQPLVVQLHNDAPGGACWESRFAVADVVRNDPSAFKAKASP